MPMTAWPAAATSRTAAPRPRRLEVARGLPEVPDAGHQHVIGAAHLVRIGREPRRVAAGGERAHHALQVVHPVVHYDDHSAPLVDGTPDHPRVEGGRAVERARERLERRLDDVVRVVAADQVQWTVSPALSTSARKNSGVRNTS